jgi:hypothetical protein
MILTGSPGIVYVMINEAMPGYVKIGKTEDLDRRLTELDWTNIPLPFECFYAARVANPTFVEQQLHEAFGDFRVRARREFFKVSPERVVAALRLAEIETVRPGSSAEPEAANSDVAQDLQEVRERRARFNFNMVGIPVGAVLTFTRDSSVTAIVVDASHVTFNGQVTSLSEAARLALLAKGLSWSAVQGPRFWQFEGEILEERRRRLQGEA